MAVDPRGQTLVEAQEEAITEVRVAGVCVRVPSRDVSPWLEAAAGVWEPETLEIVRHVVEPGDVVVDIGAWRGVVSALAAAHGARVHAFEPDPVSCQALERMLALNPELAKRIVPHQEAVGGSERMAKLSSDRMGGSGASLLRDQADSTQVRVRDAASVLEECNIADCSLLKIDVEGAEYEILPRILPLLREYRPTVLLALHTYHIREPYAHLPLLLRGVLYRLRALPAQARLIRMARKLGPTDVADPNSGRWTRLRGRSLLGAIASVKEKELLIWPDAKDG